MFKKSLLGLVVLLSLLITQSFAEGNATKESNATKEVAKKSSSSDSIEAANKLLEEMNLKNVYKNAVENSTKRLVMANPKFKKVEKDIKAFYTKYIGWDSMKSDLAKLYAKYYTASELKDITNFYKTPTGKKVLATMGKLTYEGQKITQGRLRPHLEELKKILDKAAAEPKKATKKPAKKEEKKSDKK